MTLSSSHGLAVVTGASAGIGLELARVLAEDGHDLLLAADEPDGLARAAVELEGAGPGAVETVLVDLTRPADVERLAETALALGPPLAVLALNAGIGVHGRLDEIPVADDLAVVDLDVRSTVHLAHLLVPPMVERGGGRVLVLSSIAADAPGPFHATYAASKAFLHSYAEALRHELRDSGVRITSVKPGPTRTSFFRRASMEDTAVAQGPQDDPRLVARQAWRAARADRDHVVTGSRLNLVQTYVSALVPDRISAAVAARAVRPGSGRHLPDLLRSGPAGAARSPTHDSPDSPDTTDTTGGDR